jgi:hypothetical protein
MTNDCLELAPELVRLAREHKSSLQQLSRFIGALEARARADDERYALRTSPQRWEKSRALPSQARCA